MIHCVYKNARLITLLYKKIEHRVKNWFVKKLYPNRNNLTRLRILHKQIQLTRLDTFHVMKWPEKESVKFSLPIPDRKWREGRDLIEHLTFIWSFFTLSRIFRLIGVMLYYDALNMHRLFFSFRKADAVALVLFLENGGMHDMVSKSYRPSKH
jgi:hypothetical protein